MSATRVLIVRNRVTCGAHVFSKLNFPNNIFRPIRQLLMPAKITGYTVVLLQLPVGANTTAIPCIIDVHVLTVLPGCLSWLSFLAVLPGCPSWLSFLAVLPGCPSWLSFISIIFQGHLRSHLLEVCHLPLQSLLNHLHTEQCTLFIYILQLN